MQLLPCSTGSLLFWWAWLFPGWPSPALLLFPQSSSDHPASSRGKASRKEATLMLGEQRSWEQRLSPFYCLRGQRGREQRRKENDLVPISHYALGWTTPPWAIFLSPSCHSATAHSFCCHCTMAPHIISHTHARASRLNVKEGPGGQRMPRWTAHAQLKDTAVQNTDLGAGWEEAP